MKKLIAIFTILMCVSLMGCATITPQQVSTLLSTTQNDIVVTPVTSTITTKTHF